MVRQLLLLLLLLGAGVRAYDPHHLGVSEFAKFPQLFALDEWEGCVARGHVYCLAEFTLHASSGTGAGAGVGAELLRQLHDYSTNTLEHYNHTLLHRGVCLAECEADAGGHAGVEERLERCVGARVRRSHGLEVRLHTMHYCEGQGGVLPPPDIADLLYLALLGLLVAANLMGTLCHWLQGDEPLHHHQHKDGAGAGADAAVSSSSSAGWRWVRAWSLRTSWRDLQAERPDHFTCFDFIRMILMVAVVLEHVVWLTMASYVANVHYAETMRRSAEVFLVSNSTMVVQGFLAMAACLLATKLLPPDDTSSGTPTRTYATPDQPLTLGQLPTMLANRIIRISGAYWVVVGWACTWAARVGAGPTWPLLLGREREHCRRAWPKHLLYINNLLPTDSNCLMQSWYLAADVQLYLLALVVVWALGRLRGRLGLAGLLPLLGGLLLVTTALHFTLAYALHLTPSFMMHRPEVMRTWYVGERTFQTLYVSPWGNVAGTLGGLALAVLLARLRAAHYDANRSVCTRLAHHAAFAGIFLWMVAPNVLFYCESRFILSVYAALEKPVFVMVLGGAAIGAVHGLDAWWVHVACWRGWRVPARLVFCVLLVHMHVNKGLIAQSTVPLHVTRFSIVGTWMGVCVLSWLCALVLHVCVELPLLRVHRLATASTTTARVGTSCSRQHLTPAPPTPPPPPSPPLDGVVKDPHQG